MGIAIIWFQIDSRLIIVERGLYVAYTRLSNAHVVVCFGILGIEANDIFEKI